MSNNKNINKSTNPNRAKRAVENHYIRKEERRKRTFEKRIFGISINWFYVLGIVVIYLLYSFTRG